MTILGYCDNVPELMRAADLLVTKAGPGTIAEASLAEVPVVVYDFIPGQERGNLKYVETNGIGVVALTDGRRGAFDAPHRCESRTASDDARAPSLRRAARQLAAYRRIDREHFVFGVLSDAPPLKPPTPTPFAAAL